jgi:hypothetical protein
MIFRSATPTIGGLLASPGQKQAKDKPGSIALRAIRLMRSLARMGSWAQLKSSPPKAQEMAEEMRKAESEGEKRKKKEKKKKKDGTVKEKKKNDGMVEEKKKLKEDDSKMVKKSVKGEKRQTMRISTLQAHIQYFSPTDSLSKM